jgi:hypothetical protein
MISILQRGSLWLPESGGFRHGAGIEKLQKTARTNMGRKRSVSPAVSLIY